MKSHDNPEQIHRLEDRLKRRDTARIYPFRPDPAEAFTTVSDHHVAENPPAWLHTPARIHWPEGAAYQYRLGRHRLALTTSGVAGHHETDVAQAEAEFALVVEGPLLVLGARFGETMPWAWARPYHWYFTAPAKRVVPASIALTPRTYARLWATLWITLVDDRNGRVRVRRAVALRPEFTHTLHGVLRAQALRPFQGPTVQRALERLHEALPVLGLRACVRTRCAAVSEPMSRWAVTEAERDKTKSHILSRQRK
ncbi:hypothetical protein V5E97_38965 [Singulisphaera sp. Ch08]|uniref:Uncharacterized protein n=1 Tax=Singulisphaera sp. Ch08 TaxID=3120278 RepID=A0AAU7CGL9_9BACT